MKAPVKALNVIEPVVCVVVSETVPPVTAKTAESGVALFHVEPFQIPAVLHVPSPPLPLAPQV